mmetsp:Transcript_93779/g.147495  ORF Transcript_93779/g.147495 Transcript_93779/m.147495 type:complete len:91 (-) Transcript_93779:19-291(-)
MLFHEMRKPSEFGSLQFRIPTKYGGRPSESFVAESVRADLIIQNREEDEVDADDDALNIQLAGLSLHCKNVSRLKPGRSSRLNTVVESWD